jgi:hypothetical protein
MPLKFAYSSLSGGSLDSPSASITNDKEEDYVECKHCDIHSQARRHHWKFHALSLITISSLLVVLLTQGHDDKRIAARCWDMYNYYCKTVNTPLDFSVT